MEDIPGEVLVGFGFLIFMIGLVSFSIQMTIRRRKRESDKKQATEETTQTETRTRAVAEAIRREPELAGASSSEDLARLDLLVASIQKEWLLRSDLETLERQEQAKALELERQEQARARAEEGARRRQAEKEEKVRLREARIAAMGPRRRWLATHPTIVAAVAAVLVGVVAVAAIMMTTRIQSIQAQRAAEQQAAEAAKEAEIAAAQKALALEEAKASCDFERRSEVPEDMLNYWFDCPEIQERIYAIANATTMTPEDQLRFSQEPDAAIRTALAQRSDLESQIQLALSTDEADAVRRSLASQGNVDNPDAIANLISSGLSFVVALRSNENVPDPLRSTIEGPPRCADFPVANTVWRRSSNPAASRRVFEVHFLRDCTIRLSDSDVYATSMEWSQDGETLIVTGIPMNVSRDLDGLRLTGNQLRFPDGILAYRRA